MDEEGMSDANKFEGPESTGVFAYDPASGELSGPSGETRVAPQPGALLELLMARSGEVVSRDQIREHLWAGGKVEFEQGIAFAVREIRKAMETAGVHPDPVETIPRRGFRLKSGAVQGVSGTGPGKSVGDQPRESSAAGGPVVESPPAARVTPVLIGAFGIATVLISAVLLLGRPTLPIVGIFAHQTSDDDALATLSEAIAIEFTSELTADLGDAGGVIGPTGTAVMDGPNDTDGAREIGACLIVSGAITLSMTGAWRFSLRSFAPAIECICGRSWTRSRPKPRRAL